jgi:hypothetical protein
MRRMRGVVAGAALSLAMLAAGPASSQLISIKTVPIAAGDQFQMFPSLNMGMAGVSIAVQDRLLDAYTNPAKGSRLQGASLYGAPVFYHVSENQGSGRTLPVGGLFGSATWFGAAHVSLQQIDAAQRNDGIIVLPGGVLGQQTLSSRTAQNRYAFGMLGRKLPSGLAVGGSVFHAGLEALDGVDLLYALSQEIKQSGHLTDIRLGVYREPAEGRWFEAVLLYDEMNMRHDVTYIDWVWDPMPRQGIWQTRLERNRDHTRTWGMHLGYTQPVGVNGFRVGGIITGNVKSHPKIPNYEIMNIPRDPGNSWAYNFGIGVAREVGPATFGMDLIYEPIWSDTWAEAADSVRTQSGRLLSKGARTVENDFSFSNATLRVGVKRETERAGFQLGLQIRSIDYTLEQQDNILERSRTQDESWTEWTPTWGLNVRFPELEVRYTGYLTTGTGRPSVAWTPARGAMLDAAAGADFLVAASGPLTLQEARVWSHQISVSLPLK